MNSPHNTTQWSRPATVLAIFSLMFVAGHAHAGLRQSGRWTPKYDFFTNAVNLATLRGANDTTQVLYWSLPESAFVWNPSTGGSTAPRRFPASTNLFCSGQSTLSDGRLLVIGGDDMGGVGPRTSEIFNPRDRTWTAGPTMADGRYYATGVTVGTDTVMAFSGNMFDQLITYGGRTAGSVIDSVQVLGMGHPPHWKTPVTTSPALPAREGHASIYWKWQHRMYTFGGKNGTSVYNDVHSLQYWQYANTVEDSFSVATVSPDTSSGNPSRRWRHSMILYPKSNTEVEVYVYGGLGEDSSIKSDVWRLTVDYAGSASWAPVTTSGSGPGARYGHAAVFDPGSPGTNRPRMLVFGGRSSTSTAPQDSAVYELTLTGTPTWSTLALRSGSPIPAARESLEFIADRNVRSRRESTGPDVLADENRVILWGGRNANGIIPEDKVWMLWLPDSAFAATNSKGPQWQSTTPDADPIYGRPARRLGMAGGHEPIHDFFVYTGGDTAAGSARDVWAFVYQYPQGDEVPSWQRLFPDYQIGPRTGHTLVLDGSGIFSKFPEMTNASLTSWTKLATAGHASGRLYPQVFLLPGGRLAMVGEDPDTQILNLSTGYYENRSAGYTTTNLWSGSAAMYRPGKIMKCGYAPETALTDSIPKKIIFGSAADTSSGWTNTNSGFLHRTCHNMVLLPTGEVLVTGGTRPVGGEHYALVNPSHAVYRPQMWNPNSGAWSDSSTLARDPAMRDYHSGAVLLADGRVLTAGGASKDNIDWKSAAIYSPYYVFARKDSTTDSTYATRPVVEDVQANLSYGGSFGLCTVAKANTVAMVSLIRPGAATHGYNSDQRFIPLTFTTGACSNSHELTIDEPASRFIAPPGDYMLFIVAADSTPSLARWVRVGDEPGEVVGCFDYCGGGASEIGTGEGEGQSVAILTRASAVQFGEDHAPLALPAGTKETALRLSGPEEGCLLLDQVSLLGVVEPEGWHACVVDAGLRLSRDIRKLSWPAWQEPAALDNDRHEEQGAPVDTVQLELPSKDAAAEFALALNWRVADGRWRQAPTAVQGWTSEHGWSTIRTIYPQTNWQEQCVPVERGVTAIRILFRGRPEVYAASFVELKDLPAQPITVRPDAITGAGGPAIARLLEGGDRAQLRVCAGKKVGAHFSLPQESGDGQRWFVGVRGSYVTPTGSGAGPGLSTALSLAVANPKPNPALGRTSIAFTLSRREQASVRVYGVAGRLVRELLNDTAEAGPHELVWDGRDTLGRSVSPGVYFYRVTAGSLRADRKVVILR